MFNSVKAWCNVPVTLLPFIKRDGAGDKVLGQPVDLNVYPVSETKVVKNTHGVEVVSNSHLYIDGAMDIKELDEIIFEGLQREIAAIDIYYKAGVPDIKVVYL